MGTQKAGQFARPSQSTRRLSPAGKGRGACRCRPTADTSASSHHSSRPRNPLPACTPACSSPAGIRPRCRSAPPSAGQGMPVRLASSRILRSSVPDFCHRLPRASHVQRCTIQSHKPPRPVVAACPRVDNARRRNVAVRALNPDRVVGALTLYQHHRLAATARTAQKTVKPPCHISRPPSASGPRPLDLRASPHRLRPDAPPRGAPCSPRPPIGAPCCGSHPPPWPSRPGSAPDQSDARAEAAL